MVTTILIVLCRRGRLLRRGLLSEQARAVGGCASQRASVCPRLSASRHVIRAHGASPDRASTRRPRVSAGVLGDLTRCPVQPLDQVLGRMALRSSGHRSRHGPHRIRTRSWPEGGGKRQMACSGVRDATGRSRGNGHDLLPWISLRLYRSGAVGRATAISEPFACPRRRQYFDDGLPGGIMTRPNSDQTQSPRSTPDAATENPCGSRYRPARPRKTLRTVICPTRRQDVRVGSEATRHRGRPCPSIRPSEQAGRTEKAAGRHLTSRPRGGTSGHAQQSQASRRILRHPRHSRRALPLR